MSTVLRTHGFRMVIFSEEGREPAHIHVRKGGGVAKLWLAPVRLASSEGFKAQELRQIIRLVKEHEIELITAWNELD